MKSQLVLAAALFLLPHPALAGPFDSQPKLLLHAIQVPTSKVPDICEHGRLADCATATVSAGLSTASGPYYWLYLLAARGNLANLDGFQMGIDYEDGNPGDDLNGTGIDVFDWFHCAYIELQSPTPAWPKPGAGNLITWMTTGNHPERCQSGAVAIGGYFYLGAYSADTFRLTVRPIDGVAKVATCAFQEHNLDDTRDLGFVSFSAGAATPGCNPCIEPCLFEGVPVSLTTWGAIKSQYSQ